MGNAINSFGASLEERNELRRRTDALTAEAQANWHDPHWRAQMAQALTENIYWGFETENILDIMSQVERVGSDGRIFVKETRGLRAFWTARGGYIEASTIRTDVAELVRDTLGFHVNEFEDKLENNFGETQATLIELGTKRLAAEVYLRVLRTFQAAVPSSSPYYITGSGLSLAQLNAAINTVYDTTLEGEITIIGRRTMIGQIIDQLTANNYGGFLLNTNEDLLRRGLLATYKGANVVQLVNYRDDEDISFFPANELYVVGRDASKFGFWGNPKSMEWTDEAWYWNYQARQDFGGGVYRADRIRRIVDSSIAP